MALRHVDAGGLRLAPLVPSRHGLVGRTPSPYSIEVSVPIDGGEPVPLHIVAAPNLPKLFFASGTPSVEGHQWKPCNFAWPFWAVRRCDEPAQSNCVLTRVSVNTVSTFGLGRSREAPAGVCGAVVAPAELLLEMMTNDRDLEKDEELVVYWPARASEKATPTPKPRTWREQLRGSKSTAREALPTR